MGDDTNRTILDLFKERVLTPQTVVDGALKRSGLDFWVFKEGPLYIANLGKSWKDAPTFRGDGGALSLAMDNLAGEYIATTLGVSPASATYHGKDPEADSGIQRFLGDDIYLYSRVECSHVLLMLTKGGGNKIELINLTFPEAWEKLKRADGTSISSRLKD